MYDGVRGPVRVSRALVVAAAVAVLAVVAGAGLLWYSNTSTIHALDAGSVLSGSPGDTLRIEMPPEQCAGALVTFQRKGLFGRWQQTHIGQERDIVPWYDLGERTTDSTADCATRFTVVIPADVTWSPVAACSTDMDCFVIDVVAAD